MVKNKSLLLMLILLTCVMQVNGQVKYKGADRPKSKTTNTTATRTKGKVITIAEMEALCSKKSWVEVDNYLSASGWVFYDSSKPLNDGSKKISWNYGYDRYTDMANCWFYLYVDANDESKLSEVCYQFSDNNIYNKLVNEISKKGYKRTDTKIDNNYSYIYYKNSSFSITISVGQQKRDYYDDKITVYDVYLLKSNTLLDPDNGKKSYTYSDGSSAEYTLKDGLYNGPYILRYADGTIEASMNFSNGNLTGKAIRYNEDGNVTLEANIIDSLHSTFTQYRYDENGVLKRKTEGTEKCEFGFSNFYIDFNANSKYTTWYYEKGEIKYKGEHWGTDAYGGGKIYDADSNLIKVYTSKHDTLVGEYIYNYYNNTGKLYKKYTCQYNDDGEKDGEEITTLYFSEGNYELEKYNYSNGKQNGQQQSFHYKNGQKYQFEDYYMSDGIMTGSYRTVYEDTVWIGHRDTKGKRDGLWTCFIDKAHSLDSTVRTIDTARMEKIVQGYFSNGNKNGQWYYAKWKTQCSDCEVISYEYNNGEWQSARIRQGDIERQYILDVSSIVVTEYKNAKKSSMFTSYASYNVWQDLRDGNISGFNYLTQPNGYCEVYDNEERVIESGIYRNSQKTGDWTYYYYDQNCMRVKSEIYSGEHYTTIDTKEPFKGKLVIEEDGKTYEISIKKGVRNGVTKVFENGNSKPIEKQKYKDGVRTK